MFGGLYFGQTYFGGIGGLSGRRRLVRAVVHFLNGMRTMRQVRT